MISIRQAEEESMENRDIDLGAKGEKVFTFRIKDRDISKEERALGLDRLAEIVRDIRNCYFKEKENGLGAKLAGRTGAASRVHGIPPQQSRYLSLKSLKASKERCEELFRMCLADKECHQILGNALNRKQLARTLAQYQNLERLRDKHTAEGVLVIQVLHTLMQKLKLLK